MTYGEAIAVGQAAEREIQEIARTRRPTEAEQAKARKGYRVAAKAQKALDAEIEQLYYRHASGRQINVMAIGALFKKAADLHSNGVGLELAVKAAIELFCEGVGPGPQRG